MGTNMLVLNRTFAARVALIATLSVGAGNALADDPPQLNVGPSCEAAARGAIVAGRNKAACMDDENTALADLKKNWSKYASDNKTLCIGTVRSGGPASYVELLQCLEIMRDARAIQNALPLEERIPDLEQTSGAATRVRAKSSTKARRHH